MKYVFAVVALFALVFLIVHFFPDVEKKQTVSNPVPKKVEKIVPAKCDGRIIETKSGKYCLRD